MPFPIGGPNQAFISNGFPIPRYSMANMTQRLAWPWYDL